MSSKVTQSDLIARYAEARQRGLSVRDAMVKAGYSPEFAQNRPYWDQVAIASGLSVTAKKAPEPLPVVVPEAPAPLPVASPARPKKQ